MDYAFGRSEHRLEAPDFDPSFMNAMLQGGKAGHVMKHFPWLMDALRKLPDSMLLKLSPAMGAYAKLQTVRSWRRRWCSPPITDHIR